MQHKITNANEILMNGHCSICGVTKIKARGLKKDGSKRWECSTLNSKQRKNFYLRTPQKTIIKSRWKHKYRIKLPDSTIKEYLKTTHCSCCESPSVKKLHIDHNHKTGQIRGFLCQKCNCGLGFFEDSIEKLEKAINYLKNATQKVN